MDVAIFQSHVALPALSTSHPHMDLSAHRFTNDKAFPVWAARAPCFKVRSTDGSHEARTGHVTRLGGLHKVAPRRQGYRGDTGGPRIIPGLGSPAWIQILRHPGTGRRPAG